MPGERREGEKWEKTKLEQRLCEGKIVEKGAGPGMRTRDFRITVNLNSPKISFPSLP
jgi:hypothetical protein